ncbi:hypothetical protein [Desulfovibrio litoralis]|nr:hypothetical protein [Desulfovibrio litoralis]
MSNTLTHLTNIFSPAHAITRQQFRDYLGISVSTDWRAQRAGKYPKVIKINDHERILLIDLAIFLDAGGVSNASKPKKRGRPIGSQNKTVMSYA